MTLSVVASKIAHEIEVQSEAMWMADQMGPGGGDAQERIMQKDIDGILGEAGMTREGFLAQVTARTTPKFVFQRFGWAV